MSLHISRVEVRNILGITECEFEAGEFTTITGRNGSGKSSVIKAIKSVFAGGHDATLLRKGEESGEVVFVLSDGTSITKKVTAEKSELKIYGQKAPQGYLNGISDLVSVNPISFLLGDDKTKLKILLESMPLALPVAALEELTKSKLPAGEPLEVLTLIHKRAFDERTGINRVVKEKQSTIKQLKSTLGEHSVPSDLRGQLLAEETEFNTNSSKVQVVLDALKEDSDSEIEKLREKYRSKVAELRLSTDAQASAAWQSILALRQAVEFEVVSKNTRDMIETHEIELASFEEQAVELGGVLSGIAKVKEELLSTTPFEGLSIQDGKISVGGIAFDQLNTASQIAFVVRLAKLRAGELNLVCLDGMEALDENMLAMFKQAASTSGLQFIITRVAETGLAIAGK